LAPCSTRSADAVAHTYPPVIQGYASAVAVDTAGNHYVTGWFSGTVDFNPGTGADMKTSFGDTDVFITRFNADGSYAWTQTFGGTYDDYAIGIAISDASIYVTGGFNSTDAGVGGTGSITSSGSFDAFVLALDATTGAAQSGFGSRGVQKFGGTGYD